MSNRDELIKKAEEKVQQAREFYEKCKAKFEEIPDDSGFKKVAYDFAESNCTDAEISLREAEEELLRVKG